MLYAVYDYAADTWYLLGFYSTSWEVLEFYKAMIRAPFWKDRMSALYSVGSFNQDTGEVVPCQHERICTSGSVSSISDLYPDENSGGAGGASSPQNEQKATVYKDGAKQGFFNFFKKRQN